MGDEFNQGSPQLVDPLTGAPIAGYAVLDPKWTLGESHAGARVFAAVNAKIRAAELSVQAFGPTDSGKARGAWIEQSLPVLGHNQTNSIHIFGRATVSMKSQTFDGGGWSYAYLPTYAVAGLYLADDSLSDNGYGILIGSSFGWDTNEDDRPVVQSGTFDIDGKVYPWDVFQGLPSTYYRVRLEQTFIYADGMPDGVQQRAALDLGTTGQDWINVFTEIGLSSFQWRYQRVGAYVGVAPSGEFGDSDAVIGTALVDFFRVENAPFDAVSNSIGGTQTLGAV